MKTTLFYVRLGLLCSVAAVPSFASSGDEERDQFARERSLNPGSGDDEGDITVQRVKFESLFEQDSASIRARISSLESQLEKKREELVIALLYQTSKEPSEFEALITAGERYLSKWTDATHTVQMLCAKSYMIVFLACESEASLAEVDSDKVSCTIKRANTLAQNAVDVAPSVSMNDLKFTARVAKLAGDTHGFLKVVKRMCNAPLPLPEVSYFLDGINVAKNTGQEDTALEFVKKILASYQDHPEMTEEDWLTCMRMALSSRAYYEVIQAYRAFTRLVKQTPDCKSFHVPEAARLTLIALINLGEYPEAARLHDFMMRDTGVTPMDYLEYGANLYFKAGMYDKVSDICDEMMARPDKNAGDVKAVMDMFKKLGKTDLARKTRYDLKAKNAHRKWVEMTKSVPKTASVDRAPSQRRASDMDAYVRIVSASLSQIYLNDAKALLEQVSGISGSAHSQLKADFFAAYRSLLGCQKVIVEGQAFVPSASSGSASSSSSSLSGASSSSGPSASPLAQMGKYVEQMKELVKQMKESKEERRRQAYERLRAHMANTPLEVPHGTPSERTPNVRREVLATLGLDASYPKESEGEGGASAKKGGEASSGAASSVFEADASLIQRPSPLAIGAVLKGTSRHTFDLVMSRTYGTVTRDHLKTLMGALKNTGHFEKAEVKDGAGSHMKVSLRRQDLDKRARPKPVVVAQFGVLKDYAIDALCHLFWLNGLTSEAD